MKSGRLVLAVGVILACAGFAGESQALTAQQLRDLLQRREPLVVIDVRSSREYARGHIPGALSVPGELLAARQLPPLGRVVVCGDGVGSAALLEAVRSLNARPGIVAEPLDGGMPAWESLGLPDTRAGGIEEERLPLMTYQELATAGADAEVTLVDLRTGKPSQLTDLKALFPALAQLRRQGTAGDASLRSLLDASRKGERFLVLIDNGDGRAEVLARRLKAAGVTRFSVLVGGERSLVTRGRGVRQTLGSEVTP